MMSFSAKPNGKHFSFLLLLTLIKSFVWNGLGHQVFLCPSVSESGEAGIDFLQYMTCVFVLWQQLARQRVY